MRDNEALRREIAQCCLCHRICSPEEHQKKLKEIRGNPLKLRCFLNGIGKNER